MKPKPKSTRGKSGMKPLSQILFDYVLEDKGGHITKEFQDYGYRLALELNDLRSKSLYIRLAKVEERPLLEKALVFVKETKQVKHAGRLFMWALTKLKKGEPLY